MRPRQVRRQLAMLLAISVVLGGLLGVGIAVAAADPIDEWAFLEALDGQGIGYASEAQAIAGGHAVCEYRDLGYSEFETVAMVQRNSRLSAFDSGFLVGAAEAAFCPWHYRGGRLDQIERPHISDGIGGKLKLT